MALTNRSGTIATGGTAQSLLTASATRCGYYIQNNSAGDLWISDVGTAAASQPSLKIASGGYHECPSKYAAICAVSIFGATSAQAFSAREW